MKKSSVPKELEIIRFIPVPEGLRLLDVGCGGGWFLRICKRLGANDRESSRTSTPPKSQNGRAFASFKGRWRNTFAGAEQHPI